MDSISTHSNNVTLFTWQWTQSPRINYFHCSRWGCWLSPRYGGDMVALHLCPASSSLSQPAAAAVRGLKYTVLIPSCSRLGLSGSETKLSETFNPFDPPPVNFRSLYNKSTFNTVYFYVSSPHTGEINLPLPQHPPTPPNTHPQDIWDFALYFPMYGVQACIAVKGLKL